MRYKHLLFIMFLFSTITGCKKEKPVSEPEIAPAEALNGSKFQLYKLLFDYPIGQVNDVTSTKSCQLNDIIEFKTNGGFSYNDKGACIPVNNSIFKGFDGGGWAINANDTTLSLRISLFIEIFHFGKVTRNSVELTQKKKNYFQDDEKYSYFLKRVN